MKGNKNGIKNSLCKLLMVNKSNGWTTEILKSTAKVINSYKAEIYTPNKYFTQNL